MYIYYIIAIIVIGLDQFTKYLVVKKMELGESIAILEPTFKLLSHRNRGAAWGMFEGQIIFFTIVTLVVIAGILYYFQKEAKGKPLFQFSLMLLLGGAIGNFIDRLFRGEVVDFFSVLIPIIQYDFPIFNIADAALTIGVILLMIAMLFEEKSNKKKVSDKHGNI